MCVCVCAFAGFYLDMSDCATTRSLAEISSLNPTYFVYLDVVESSSPYYFSRRVECLPCSTPFARLCVPDFLLGPVRTEGGGW